MPDSSSALSGKKIFHLKFIIMSLPSPELEYFLLIFIPQVIQEFLNSKGSIKGGSETEIHMECLA